MDVLLLSRLQFAVACFFHFLFVPLTLGLGVLVALMETAYVRTGNKQYQRMSRFWGKIFVINFAIGVVTGITLEFQIGTNWSRYSEYVGDIFGSLLAIEATVAFFLESTFLAVWYFGRQRLSPKMSMMSIWIVALASITSAFWILCANAWMQHPVGYVIQNGRAELTDFFAVITQRTAIIYFLHTLFGAMMLSGFFLMGVSAWHIRRKTEEKTFFEKSFRMGAWTAICFLLLEGITGHFSAVNVAERQPMKLAAMESLWEGGPNAPMHLIVIPDEKNERNLVEFLTIPSGLSLLVDGNPDKVIHGLNDPESLAVPRPNNPVVTPEDRPPVTIVFFAFRFMVSICGTLIMLASIAWLWRKNPGKHEWFMRLMPWVIPLPYIAFEMGWIVTEVGRQPWIVNGMMRTAEAVSPIASSQVAVSLIAFIGVYSILGLANFLLLARVARRGPKATDLETTESAGGGNA